MNRKIKLSEIVKIAGRVGWKGYTVDDLREEGPWVIGANDITTDNRLDLSKAKHISREKYEESPEIKIELNDILIVKVGSTIGKVAIINRDIGEACINPNSVILKNCKINSSYLYYFLISSAGQAFLRNNSSASAQSALNQLTLKEMLIDLVDEQSQENISALLNNLNSKIELNNRINAELEAMAKTLYDYWFVQFDFPDENGKPYKTSGGKMVWNEKLKREIPEGWEVKELGEIINIFDSKRIPLSRGEREKKVGNIPYYGATSVMGYVNEYIFDDDYILIAEDGSVMDDKGFPIVQFIWGKTWVNNHAHVIQAKNVINNEYIFYLVKTISVIQIMSGSIQLKINQENLKSVKVCVPDENTLEKFASFAIPVRKQLINASEENQKLTELRDWLLPMLMNGQVKVS
jgi:type I restriction enzyme S subunit